MKTGKIIISSATRKDCKELMIWFKHYESKSLIKKRVECYIEHNSTIIAKCDDKIVGVLQWYIKEEPDDGVAEIEEVFVSKEYRRSGIGSLLVSSAIDFIKKYFIKLRCKPRIIFLLVGKDNVAARKLYEKHGFKFVNSVGNLFADDEEELFYSRKF